MLHILTKVKIVIMSIIDSIRICNANSNESEIILIQFINNKIIKDDYKHILCNNGPSDNQIIKTGYKIKYQVINEKVKNNFINR